jgi:hypothetical protein
MRTKWINSGRSKTNSRSNLTSLQYCSLPVEDRSKLHLWYKEVSSSANSQKITQIRISMTIKSYRCIFNHLKHKIWLIYRTSSNKKIRSNNLWRKCKLKDLNNKKTLKIEISKISIISIIIKIKHKIRRINKLKRLSLIMCRARNINRTNKWPIRYNSITSRIFSM